MTSWIDGSFIYSTSEVWVNTMRAAANGSFRTDAAGRMPVLNTMRVPLFNNPVPNVMQTYSPERLFCKLFCSLLHDMPPCRSSLDQPLTPNTFVSSRTRSNHLGFCLLLLHNRLGHLTLVHPFFLPKPL